MTESNSTRPKPSLFRKTCQAIGVVLIVWAIYWSAQAIAAVVAGEMTVEVGLTKILLSLAMLGGTGALLLYFEPRKAIQAIASSYSLDKLVSKREDLRSFAEKIHVDEDEDY